MDEARGFECLWGNISEHPQCPHGPTLLFAANINGKINKFYACSACRDRKLCRFYLKHGENLSEFQQNFWNEQRQKLVPPYQHQELSVHFNILMSQDPTERYYCHDCEKLISFSERSKHTDHKLIGNLSNHQMHHPTEVLKPLNNPKKEAQYLFSKKSTTDLVNMLLKLGAKQVLCIGAPRIHEYISENLNDKMNSLLLDLDNRFHNFFGPLNYCWYNLFNNHFFYEDAKDVYKNFMTQNGGKDTFIICDPPFGGRLEPISQTIKTITDQHKKWNDISADGDSLKIFFVSPYFMEPAIREKSTPHSLSGGLRELKMADYRVNYDNHPLFVTKSTNNNSPVRIFTNVLLRLLQLPSEDGYKYCKRCQKWVYSENKHCKKCKACTTKHGKTYKHCNICSRCVKSAWKHCDTCNRCCLEKHVCGQGPKIKGRCFKCDEYGHTEKDCEASKEEDDQNKGDVQPEKSRKRKYEDESKSASKKTVAAKKFKTAAKPTKKEKRDLAKNLKAQNAAKVKLSKAAKVVALKLQKKSKSTLKQNKFKERKGNSTKK